MSGANTVSVPRPVPLLVALARVIRDADLFPDQRADLACRVSDVLQREVHGFGRAMERSSSSRLLCTRSCSRSSGLP